MLRFNKWLLGIVAAVILVYGSGVGTVSYYFIRNKVLAHHGICAPDDNVDISMFRWWPHAAFGIGAYLANPAGTVHIPPNYTETMAANLVQTKNSAGFYFEGAAIITMNSFQVTKASGIHQTFIRSLVPFGFFGSAVGVKWVYTGNSSAFVSGDSSADSTGLEWENFAVDISGAGSSASCFDIVRTNRQTLKNLECNGAGGANSQVGLIEDGNGNFSGDSNIFNFIGGSLLTCIKLINSANANTIIGGACPGVVAGGKAIDIQSGNGNVVILYDVEGAPTAVNVAANINNFGNRVSCYCQGNTTDVIVGAGAIANMFDNVGANCTSINPTITDAGTNTTLWNPCKFKMDKDGNLTILTGFVSSAAYVGSGITAGTGDIRLQNTGSIKFRNAANSADISALSVNGSNQAIIGAPLGVNGDSVFSASPRALWPATAFSVVATGPINRFFPDKAITVTAVSYQVPTGGGTTGLTCATAPVIQLHQGSTTGATISFTNATAAGDTGGTLPLNLAAGTAVVMEVVTAAAGCGTNWANVNVTYQYRMQ
jgi:hypothetical protein